MDMDHMGINVLSLVFFNAVFLLAWFSHLTYIFSTCLFANFSQIIYGCIWMENKSVKYPMFGHMYFSGVQIGLAW